MKCVHFGAGNIGRGFVGLLMHRSGYEVVFADVAAPLIDALASTPSYTVHEVGAGSRDTAVEGYRALNSADDPESVVAEIATADVVTTAVGAHILKFVAPLVARGIAARPDGARAAGHGGGGARPWSRPRPRPRPACRGAGPRRGSWRAARSTNPG